MPSSANGSSPAPSSVLRSTSAAARSRSTSARVRSNTCRARVSPTTARTSAALTRRLSAPPASAAFSTSPHRCVRSSPASWTSSAAASSVELDALGAGARPEPRHELSADRRLHGDGERPRNGLVEPVGGRERLRGEQHQDGRRIRRPAIAGQRVGGAGAELLDAPGDDEPAGPDPRQEQGGVHDALDTGLARVEDLAREREVAAVREEAAGDATHGVVQEQGLRPVEQRDRRRRARVRRLQEPRVVHRARSSEGGFARLPNLPQESIAPAKPALEAVHACSMFSDRLLEPVDG